uniref:hypothetical protein n=1 Tax=Gordonia sp. B7-2 TaxID=3420932 RepID=UPI003D90AB67
MTTIVYFVIAAVALAGAVVLLWLDRQRSNVARHQRAVWGDEHEFKFRESDTKLRKVFHRATMNVPDHAAVRDVAYGHYGGAEAVVFDLVDTSTVVAVRRSGPSPVVIDLRHEDVLAPMEEDVELLGAMGPRVMFSNNLDVARRVCDRRMVALANKAPAYVEVLWNEGNWALGSMPLTNDAAHLNAGLEVVRRFADLLRVLPPVRDPQDTPDPRDPHGPTRAELADEKTESMRDKERRRRGEAAPNPAAAPNPDRRPAQPRQPAPAPAPSPATATTPTRGARGLSPMPVRRERGSDSDPGIERPNRHSRD